MLDDDVVAVVDNRPVRAGNGVEVKGRWAPALVFGEAQPGVVPGICVDVAAGGDGSVVALRLVTDVAIFRVDAAAC